MAATGAGSALLAFFWANLGQYFSIAVLMTTVGDALPISPSLATQLVGVLGVAYLGKQIWYSLREARSAVEDETES
ncbi:hypothetical protein BRD20_10110 [Halobacteriales archaeon SW_8_65_20]|nr:MAG: hypothetical protein BRD20_10110 [Halobacteriales archaeon SW_8_65_20]